MPDYVVSKTMEALNHRQVCLSGSRILVLGVAYKPDIDDMRESPALRIMEILESDGAKVDYNDPYIPKVSEQRQTKLRKESVPLSEQVLKQYDAVIIVTNHSSYDYQWIVKNSQLVVDTRGVTKGIDAGSEKIVRA